MKTYYINSILHNKKKYALVIAISTIAFSFCFVMMQFIFTMFIDKKDAEFEDMFTLLILFSCIILSSVIAMLSTVYKIIYMGRKMEMKNLKYIGFSTARIKTIYYNEALFLSAGISIIGFVLGQCITNIFNYFYNEPVKISVTSIVIYFFVVNTLFFITVRVQMKICMTNIQNDESKDKRKVYLRKSYMTMLFCITIYIVYVLLHNLVLKLSKSLNIEFGLINEIVVTILVLISIKSMVVIILLLLSKIVQKLKVPNLYLTLKRLMYDMPKTIKLVSNSIFAIALLLFFLVMFNSIPKSTIEFIEDNTMYNHKYTDTMFLNNEKIKLDKDKFIASTLEVVGSTSNNKKVIIKGVDEKYKNIEKISISEGVWDDIKIQNSNYVPIVISGIDAKNNNWNIGDLLQLKFNEATTCFKVVAIRNSFIYGEAYADRKLLSEAIFNENDLVNTWYSTEKILLEDKADNDRFEHITREKIIDNAKESVLGGTEIILMILYIYAISSLCMLFNIFIITSEESKDINIVLKNIGLAERRIGKIQILEVAITILTSVIGGFLLGYWAICGLPDIAFMLYKFRVDIYIPVSVYIIFFTTILLYILCVKIIKGYTMKNLEGSES